MQGAWRAFDSRTLGSMRAVAALIMVIMPAGMSESLAQSDGAYTKEIQVRSAARRMAEARDVPVTAVYSAVDVTVWSQPRGRYPWARTEAARANHLSPFVHLRLGIGPSVPEWRGDLSFRAAIGLALGRSVVLAPLAYVAEGGVPERLRSRGVVRQHWGVGVQATMQINPSVMITEALSAGKARIPLPYGRRQYDTPDPTTIDEYFRRRPASDAGALLWEHTLSALLGRYAGYVQEIELYYLSVQGRGMQFRNELELATSIDLSVLGRLSADVFESNYLPSSQRIALSTGIRTGFGQLSRFTLIAGYEFDTARRGQGALVAEGTMSFRL